MGICHVGTSIAAKSSAGLSGIAKRKPGSLPKLFILSFCAVPLLTLSSAENKARQRSKISTTVVAFDTALPAFLSGFAVWPAMFDFRNLFLNFSNF